MAHIRVTLTNGETVDLEPGRIPASAYGQSVARFDIVDCDCSGCADPRPYV